MRVLVVSDNEQRELWDFWDSVGSKRLEGIDLILSAGDLKPAYLEFLVTMTGLPLLYVRGNHDSIYAERPPEGCVDIDGKVAEVRLGQEDKYADIRVLDPKKPGTLLRSYGQSNCTTLIIAGLGGSMRYRDGSDMYTEREMERRVRQAGRILRAGRLFGLPSTESGQFEPYASNREIRLLLTHAPSLGHGDLEDLPHMGFACFNNLIEEWRPDYHCYGHVHMEYGLIRRESVHPAGTRLINCSGMYILEI